MRGSAIRQCWVCPTAVVLSATASIHVVARSVTKRAVGDLPATREEDLEPEVGFCSA